MVVLTAYPLFISSPEIMVVIVVAVMLFGADKIPDIAHGLGKGLRQIRNATNEIKNEIQKSAEDYNPTKALEDVKKDIKDIEEDIEDSIGPIKRR